MILFVCTNLPCLKQKSNQRKKTKKRKGVQVFTLQDETTSEIQRLNLQNGFRVFG